MFAWTWGYFSPVAEENAMRLSLRYKIIGLAFLAALIPFLLISIITPGLEKRLENQLSDELDGLAQDNVGQIAEDVYRLCSTVHQLQVDRVIKARVAASTILEEDGGASLLKKTVRWKAYNPLTNRNSTLELPALAIGGEWIGKQTSLTEDSPVVDKVKRLTGADCSLYQRINAEGDMLRAAATTTNADGRRIIGRILPAKTADGRMNPAIQAALQMQNYHEEVLPDLETTIRNFEPVFSPNGDVIGMMEVSLSMNIMHNVLKALSDTSVGKSGYVWVLGADGKDKGQYILSQDNLRDGENILNATDAAGRGFVQEIISDARRESVNPGHISYKQYNWKNPGDPEERTKLAAFTYFAPWDWVVGAGAYLDDYHDARMAMRTSMEAYTQQVLACGGVVLFIVLILSFHYGSMITDPIRRMVTIAQDVAECDVESAGERMSELALSQPALSRKAETGSSSGLDETGQLYIAMLGMINNLNSLVGQVQRSGVQVTTSSTEIAASARQMEATVESNGANTAEVSSAVNEITATSRNLLETVRNVLESTNKTAALAAKGRKDLSQMARTMGALSSSTDSITGKLADLFDKANDVVSIISTITKVADQTNLLSLNASIEAEKAGDYGLGFAVVAREIRRLADQTAVAALDIEKRVNEMLDAVSEGVDEMERFTTDVKNGVDETHKIGGSLEEIMLRVQDLEPRLETVSEGARGQSEGASQISRAMADLSTAAQHASEAVRAFNQVAAQLNQAVQALQSEVTRFKVSS
jgi:methyl-accepting chemotaxis protein WspA